MLRKRHHNLFLMALTAVVVAGPVLLCGCASDPLPAWSDDRQMLRPPSGEGLVPRSQSPVADVPAPVGFVLVQSRSTSDVVHGVRRVNHLYQGLAPLSAVVDYYRQHLQAHGWQRRGERIEGQIVHLYYQKPGQRLYMRITKPQRVINVQLLIGDEAAGVPAMPLTSSADGSFAI